MINMYSNVHVANLSARRKTPFRLRLPARISAADFVSSDDCQSLLRMSTLTKPFFRRTLAAPPPATPGGDPIRTTEIEANSVNGSGRLTKSRSVTPGADVSLTHH
jgi:hypothetical protein